MTEDDEPRADAGHRPAPGAPEVPDPAAAPGEVAAPGEPAGDAEDPGWAAPQHVWDSAGEAGANHGPDHWGGHHGPGSGRAVPGHHPGHEPAHDGGSFWQPRPAQRPGVGLVALTLLLAAAVLAGIGIGRSLPGRVGASGAAGLSGLSGGASGTPSGHAGSAPPSGSAGAGSSGAAGTGGKAGNSSASGVAPPAAAVARVAGGITPSLVDIDTSLGYDGLEAAGTGIVLSADGLVLTNNHVISGETALDVVDLANDRHYQASILGYDESADVAVLQLRNASGLPVAPLSLAQPRIGEQVVAVGNAGGRGGKPTAAGGSITGLDRSITASDQGVGTTEQLSGLIQTSADIQLGDSGGSLVDMGGQVVGMDTAALQGFSFSEQGNEGFAIPIGTATAIARSIEAGRGSATVHIGATAFIGVRAAARTCTTAAGAPSIAAGSGAVVCSVLAGTPAAGAGLRVGDVITAVDGRSITGPTALTRLLIASYHPGQDAGIAFRADYGRGSAGQVTVRLGSGPPG